MRRIVGRWVARCLIALLDTADNLPHARRIPADNRELAGLLRESLR